MVLPGKRAKDDNLRQRRRQLRLSSVIEVLKGHLKKDRLPDRSWRKGNAGDASVWSYVPPARIYI